MTDARRRLESQAKQFWIVSSVWNGRIEVGGELGYGTFIKKVQMMMSAASHWRLVLLYGKLIEEVIRLGNKQNVLPYDINNPPQATIHELKFNHIPEDIADRQFVEYQKWANEQISEAFQ